MVGADPKGIIKAVLHNGVGRYVCQLQRITLRFCKEWGHSCGIREFIEHDLIDFARKNPGIVVYLQPQRHRNPSLYAEYLNGCKEQMRTPNYSREDIIKWLEHMRTRSGFPYVKYLKTTLTLQPTIQGAWTPWTNQPTEWNLLKHPAPEQLVPIKTTKSATDIVLELAAQQGLRNILRAPAEIGNVEEQVGVTAGKKR